MQDREINTDEAAQILSIWQAEGRPVEVVLRLCPGVMQTQPGNVRVEPDRRVVVANVVNKDHYLTTVIDMLAFDSIRLIDSENAITFAEPSTAVDGVGSVTIACRKR